LFWSGFGIYSGSKNKEAAWQFLRFYAGEVGAAVWKDWGLPTVKSIADSTGLSRDPIEGVWLRELNYLAPRAYIFTPYWGEIGDPLLHKVLEDAIGDPTADIPASGGRSGTTGPGCQARSAEGSKPVSSNLKMPSFILVVIGGCGAVTASVTFLERPMCRMEPNGYPNAEYLAELGATHQA
jgi:hypothetical protein